jgi:hypothetical protein
MAEGQNQAGQAGAGQADANAEQLGQDSLPFAALQRLQTVYYLRLGRNKRRRSRLTVSPIRQNLGVPSSS